MTDETRKWLEAHLEWLRYAHDHDLSRVARAAATANFARSLSEALAISEDVPRRVVGGVTFRACGWKPEGEGHGDVEIEDGLNDGWMFTDGRDMVFDDDDLDEGPYPTAEAAMAAYAAWWRAKREPDA